MIDKTQPIKYPVRIERHNAKGMHQELVVSANRVVIAETLLRMLNETDDEIKVSYSKCDCEDPVNNCEWPGFHHYAITGNIEI